MMALFSARWLSPSSLCRTLALAPVDQLVDTEHGWSDVTSFAFLFLSLSSARLDGSIMDALWLGKYVPWRPMSYA
jgi:hypothetical protein